MSAGTTSSWNTVCHSLVQQVVCSRLSFTDCLVANISSLVYRAHSLPAETYGIHFAPDFFFF